MDPITCLQWQPLQANPRDDERLIATGAEDNLLCIWNARNPVSVPKYAMNMDGPVLALAFSPDGLFLAGSTAERILVWKVGDTQLPKASWSRAPHPGWFSPRSNGDQEDEDTHTLCWDATGQKLAYAANSRVSTIPFAHLLAWMLRHTSSLSSTSHRVRKVAIVRRRVGPKLLRRLARFFAGAVILTPHPPSLPGPSLRDQLSRPLPRADQWVQKVPGHEQTGPLWSMKPTV